MGANENFQIIENLGLIIVSQNDKLNHERIETVISDLAGNPFFKRGYDVLIDVRNSVTKMKSGEIEIFRNFVFNNLTEIGINKFAILSRVSPIYKTVEFVRYYKQSSRYQVFSSLNAALYWLGIPVDRKLQVNIKLTYLKDNYLYLLNFC